MDTYMTTYGLFVEFDWNENIAYIVRTSAMTQHY